jgi:Tol biopolymer transport system component
MSRTRSGNNLVLGSQLGSAGGEATVFAVKGTHVHAFKRYHQPTRARLGKLDVMVAVPPSDPTWTRSSHRSIAWPLEIVMDDQGGFEGFIMPRIVGAKPMSAVYHPRDRRNLKWGWTWRHLLRVAQNTASAVEALHRGGYVIGDVNTQNVLVKQDALITLIDCDSMQVPGPAGDLHRCPVGTPDFTAPEIFGQLRHRAFEDIDRTRESDTFALAILIYLLLMEGTHPYAGVWRGAGDPPDRAVRMREGLFAFGADPRVAPPTGSPSFDLFPPSLQRLFTRAFVSGASQPKSRPSADEWRRALAGLDHQLAHCPSNRFHIFSSHLPSCPWCDRIRQLGVADPFPGPTRAPSGPHRPANPLLRPIRPQRTQNPHVAPPVPTVGGTRSGRRGRRIAVAVAALLVMATWGRFGSGANDVSAAERPTVSTENVPNGSSMSTPTTTATPPSTSASVAVPTAAAVAPVLQVARDTIVFSQTLPDREVIVSSVNADGSGLTELDSGSPAVEPTYGPDGKQLAFARRGDFSWRIYISTAAGGRGKQACPIKADTCRNPSWDSEAKRLAYTCGNAICIVEVDGTGDAVIDTWLDEAREPVFSPNGSSLVFVGRTGTDEDLYLLDLNTGEIVRLTELPGALGSPDWAPDGERIAFTLYPDGLGQRRADIYLVSRDGTAVSQLTDSGVRDQHPTWAPGGKRIAFVSDRNNLKSVVSAPPSQFPRPQLFVMNADGSDQKMISDVEARDPHWSPMVDRR